MDYVYIVECSDHTLYTGWTNNLDNRINTHNAGKGAKYTRARLPVSLVYYEICNNRSDAMRREYQIKQMSRSEKLELIRRYNNG